VSVREKAISRQLKWPTADQPERDTGRLKVSGRLNMTNEDMTSEAMPKWGDDSMALCSLGAFSKGAQAIAVEIVDYTKKSAETTAAAWEKLMAAKSLEKAIEVQTEYLKASYEDFIAEASKLGELYVDLAKETYKPFDVLLSKAA
jgi:phasin family protein